MISLVFMTDPKRVVGGSSILRNMIRMPFLPLGELSGAMDKAMAGDYAVMGSGSAAFYAGNAKKYKKTYLLTRNRQHKASAKGLDLCHDANTLIERFKDSDEELLVLGGLSTWRQFLPFANKLRVVETINNVPGDLVFDDWENAGFKLASEERGKQLVTKYYAR